LLFKKIRHVTGPSYPNGQTSPSSHFGIRVLTQINQNGYFCLCFASCGCILVGRPIGFWPVWVGPYEQADRLRMLQRGDLNRPTCPARPSVHQIWERDAFARTPRVSSRVDRGQAWELPNGLLPQYIINGSRLTPKLSAPPDACVGAAVASAPLLAVSHALLRWLLHQCQWFRAPRLHPMRRPI
jgi:hypothetical protein